jgi:hypothetical protein
MSATTATRKIRLSQFDLRPLRYDVMPLEGVTDRDERRIIREDNAAAFRSLVGQTFYLVESENLNRRRSKSFFHLREECPRTNMSREDRPVGWLGTTDNVWRYAHGRYTVTDMSSTHLHLTEAGDDE